jgi:cytochrome P450
VDQALSDDQAFSGEFAGILADGNTTSAEGPRVLDVGWPKVDTMFTSDERDHTGLHALDQKVFGRARLKRMSDLVESTVRERIDNFTESVEYNSATEFASPLPVSSVGEIIGIPLRDRSELHAFPELFNIVCADCIFHSSQ